MAGGGEEKSSFTAKKRKCVIEDVILKDRSKVEPLFVTFANGRPLENANLQVKLHHNNSGNFRDQDKRILTVETTKLDYVGKNFGEEPRPLFANQSVFLGVLNKATGKMKLIETSAYCVSPILSAKNTASDLVLPFESLTYAEKQQAISSEFGTKRSQQMVNRRNQYKVNAQNMSGAIDQATTSVTLEPKMLKEDLTTHETFAAVLPKCNREASTVEDVYKLESIAPDHVWESLASPAKVLLREEQIESKTSVLFQQLIANSKSRKNEDDKIRTACIALYVEYLITFLKCRGRELQNSKGQDNLLNDCPPRVKQYILKEYTETHHQRKVRSNLNEDRATCCVLILSLMANKYKQSVKTLLQSLSINRDRLNNLMKVVGATYVSDRNSYELKIPLAKFFKAHKRVKPSNKGWNK